VGFLERDFERDHLAEKSNRTKMGKNTLCMDQFSPFGLEIFIFSLKSHQIV
jgi:hypothetical protein